MDVKAEEFDVEMLKGSIERQIDRIIVDLTATKERVRAGRYYNFELPKNDFVDLLVRLGELQGKIEMLEREKSTIGRPKEKNKNPSNC